MTTETGPRRAKFVAKIDINEQDLLLKKQNNFVNTAIATNNPMVDIPIESIFAFDRIKYPITIRHFLFFIFWTPIGIPLFVFRFTFMMFFMTFFYWIAKVPYLRRIRVFVPFFFTYIGMPMCGIFHSVRGKKYKSSISVDKCIFVSNHISNFDPLFFNCIFNNYTLLCDGNYQPFWNLMKRIGILNDDDEQGQGCIYTSNFGTADQKDGVRLAIDEDMARDDARPFLLYPEGCVTTGVAAVMQYQKFVFGLDKVVVPVCLSIYNPWPFEHYVLGSKVESHLMWIMFSPFVIMRHALLEPQKKGKDEAVRDFALRVQCMTAAHLQLGVIKMNWKQKDRLSQALGFNSYSENMWSRRESMEEFKKSLFDRQVVLRDGVAFDQRTDVEMTKQDDLKVIEEGERRGSMFQHNTNMMCMNEQAKEAAFLAREYANRHVEDRNPEMKHFDEAMVKANINNAGIFGSPIMKKKTRMVHKINEEFVNKVNIDRRRMSLETGKPMVELETFQIERLQRTNSVRERKNNNRVNSASEAGSEPDTTVNSPEQSVKALGEKAGLYAIEPGGSDVAKASGKEKPALTTTKSRSQVAPAPLNADEVGMTNA
jgi:hypothetical protein